MSDPTDISPLDDRGWHRGVRHCPSPHHDARPEGSAIELLVVHNISLPPGEFGGDSIEAIFLGRLDTTAHPFFAQLAELRVSTHFLVRRDGAVVQFVACRDRAWHAGRSAWRGRERCNDFSVGIELEGVDHLPYAEPQYARLIDLTRVLCDRYPICDVVGHADIAPARKTDPGPAFDWNRVRRACDRWLRNAPR